MTTENLDELKGPNFDNLVKQLTHIMSQRREQFVRATIWKHFRNFADRFENTSLIHGNPHDDAIVIRFIKLKQIVIRESPEGKIEFLSNGKVLETLEGWK